MSLQLATSETIAPKYPLVEKPQFLEQPPYNEKSGFRKFLKLSGNNNPYEAGIRGASYSFRDLLKSLIGDNPQTDLSSLIRIIAEQDTPDQPAAIQDIFEQIKIFTQQDTDLNFALGIEVLERDSNTAEASEILTIITEEIINKVHQGNKDEEMLSQILLSTPSYPHRIRRLANILGLDEQFVQNQSLGQILDYLSQLSKEVDEVTDFEAAAGSYARTRSFLPETSMLDKVVPQTGTECVLYSTLNLANAAHNQGALVEEVGIEEMQRLIPQGEGTTYRRMSNEWTDYLISKGYKVASDFSWGEALRLLQQKQAGLIMRIFNDHAIAVVGIRHNQENPRQLEFFVANSLASYPPIPPSPDQPTWVKAQEIVSQAGFLEPGTDIRQNIYLVSWNSLHAE